VIIDAEDTFQVRNNERKSLRLDLEHRRHEARQSGGNERVSLERGMTGLGSRTLPVCAFLPWRARSWMTHFAPGRPEGPRHRQDYYHRRL
jgi:hypothetical protein